MVRIKPFQGVRPPKELASEVASRPYDVLNSAEAKAEATERSLLHIIKPEIDFDRMIRAFTTRPSKTSTSSSRKAGCVRIPKRITISMRRR